MSVSTSPSPPSLTPANQLKESTSIGCQADNFEIDMEILAEEFCTFDFSSQ